MTDLISKYDMLKCALFMWLTGHVADYTRLLIETTSSIKIS